MDNSITPSTSKTEITNINNATYDTSSIFSSINLPISNRIVPNRLVKVALYEHGASFGGGPPTSAFHIPLYARWARGGWGIIMTGNVQVSGDHLTLGRDLIVPREDDGEARAAYRELASTIHKYGTPGALAIMQFSHAGRQSPNILGGRGVWGEPPVAPSSVPLSGQGPIGSLLFRTPRAMEEEEIDRVVASFVNGARLALDAGFDGVELHASHGYLLSQFMSIKTNKRTDAYSCLGTNTLRFLHRIVTGIRGVSPPDFVLGIKLNAADYTSGGGDSEERALEHLRIITTWKMVDFIEISGGDYENPDFMTTDMLIKSPRQAFFARFSQQAMGILNHYDRPPIIMLTGGMRTRYIMSSALAHQHAHLLGVGRAAVLCPELPVRLQSTLNTQGSGDADSNFLDMPLLEPKLNLPSLISLLPLPKLIGAGVGMAWYTVMMHRISRGAEIDHNLRAIGAVIEMWLPRHFNFVWNCGSRGASLSILLFVAVVTTVVAVMPTYLVSNFARSKEIV